MNLYIYLNIYIFVLREYVRRFENFSILIKMIGDWVLFVISHVFLGFSVFYRILKAFYTEI